MQTIRHLAALLILLDTPPVMADLAVDWIRPLSTSDDLLRPSLVEIDSLGNIFVAGTYSVARTDGARSWVTSHAYFSKYDATGKELWSSQLGTDRSSRPLDIVVDGSGALYVGGQIDATEVLETRFSPEILVMKYAPGGDLIWQHTYQGETGGAWANDIALDETGAAYVSGAINSSSFGCNQADGAFVSKYSSIGAMAWIASSPDLEAISEYRDGQTGHGVSIDEDGDIYSVGSIHDGPSCGDDGDSTEEAFLRKYDQAGDLLWDQRFGERDIPFRAMANISDGFGHVYITGTMDSRVAFDGSVDVFFRKYATSGELLWTDEFGVPNLDEYSSKLIFDDFGKIIHVLGLNVLRSYGTDGQLLWDGVEQFGVDAIPFIFDAAADADGGLLLIASPNELSGELFDASVPRGEYLIRLHQVPEPSSLVLTCLTLFAIGLRQARSSK